MIIKKVKELYLCEHCRKVYQIKSFCEKHEPTCWKNPDNMSMCHNCKYIEKKEVDVTEFDTEGYDYQVKKGLLFCNKKEIFIYPFWISNPILSENLPNETDNIVMPTKCDDFNDAAMC